MGYMCLIRQHKEPLHALNGEISGLVIILSAPHSFPFGALDIKPISIPRDIYLVMPVKPLAVKITPEMEEYIRARSTDMRVATTCEGPLIFSIKTSPPKATDHTISIGERKIYISAVQAPYIKAIDEKMLPRCAMEKRKC
jgi:hypothetical protein